ncbi:hypothetical protein ACQPVP_05945 [Clostridium nigeriense]|uniref:hypothetical protein n=1 Tax=Clostridium nigeriense TaxID=1805470 RepID=UPI003D33AAA8
MNKKFILVSLSIFILSFIFILGFKFALDDKVLYEDSVNYEQDKPMIKYVGFEEEDDFYKIKISVKNSTDYYASFYDINLQFSNNSSVYLGNAGPIFKGYDNDERKALLNYKEGDKYDFSSYFGPNEEREYVFEISKGLKFDKEVFDTNRMTISYNIQYFKYKINKNTVVGNAFSSSSVEFIDNTIDPYTIE